MSTKAERKRQERIRKNIGIAVKVLIAVACLVLGIIYYVEQYKSKEEGSDTYSITAGKDDTRSDADPAVSLSAGKKNSETKVKTRNTDESSKDKEADSSKDDLAVATSGVLNENRDMTVQTDTVEKGTGIVERGTEDGGKPLENAQEEPTLLSGNSVIYDGKININTAGVDELCKLKGIGEKRAKDIIEYRDTHGSFAKIEDIMKVKGIKQGIFSKIKDEITAG